MHKQFQKASFFCPSDDDFRKIMGSIKPGADQLECSCDTGACDGFCGGGCGEAFPSKLIIDWS